MDDLARLISLQDANTRTVLGGAGLLGLAAGVVGSFAVLRRRALMGDALAHAALPGVGAAYLMAGGKHFSAMLAGALVSGLVGVAAAALLRSYTRIKEDAAIGIVLSVFFGAGVALSGVIQRLPGGNRAGLDGFLFGKAASMVRSDVETIAAVTVASIACVAAMYKEFKMVCFDRAFARAQGWPVGALDLVMMALVALVVSAGLPAVGVVLMAGMLIIPAVSARFWTDKLGVMVVLSGVIGAASGVIGSGLSAVVPSPAGTLTRGWPTGPLIAIVAGAVFVGSMLASPRRGVIAEALRRAGLARRIGDQHLLRWAWEHEERGLGAWTPESVSHGARAWPARLALGRAIRSGAARAAESGYLLTAEGREEARRVVRAHRLWELYLIEAADIAPDHVHRDADELEHVLPASVIAALEERLRAQGRLPESPHPVRGVGRERALDAPGFGGLVGNGNGVLRVGGVWAAGVLFDFETDVDAGDAISHAILPGIAVAFIVSGSMGLLPMLAGAMAAGLVTAGLTAGIGRVARVHDDASMGVVFTIMFSVGVLLITWVAPRIDLDPGCVLYGVLELTPLNTVSVLGVEAPRALVATGAMLVVTVAAITLFFKELKIVSFDAGLATALGLRAGLVHACFLALVAAVCVASFEAVGSILVVAMLIVPGATAHLLTDRLGRMLWISAGVGVVSAVGGYLSAFALDTSASGMMSVSAGACFVLAVAFAPRHGVAARVAQLWVLSVRIAAEDIVASLYRAAEGREQAASEELAMAARRTSRWAVASAWLWLRATGRVRGRRLTEKGRAEGAALIRSHRLWEGFLAANTPLALDHLHEPSHRVEHFLGRDLRDRLAREVGETDPQGRQIPRE